MVADRGFSGGLCSLSKDDKEKAELRSEFRFLARKKSACGKAGDGLREWVI